MAYDETDAAANDEYGPTEADDYADVAYDASDLGADDALGYASGEPGAYDDPVTFDEAEPDHDVVDAEGERPYADDQAETPASDEASAQAGMSVGDILAAAGPRSARAVDGYELYDDATSSGPVDASDAASAFGVTKSGYVSALRPDAPQARRISQPPQPDYLPVTRVMPPAAPEPPSAPEDAESEAAIVALEARRKKRRRRRGIVIGVVVVAVLAAGAFFGLRALSPQVEEEQAVAPATVVVTREEFSSIVTSQGALQPLSSATVTPAVDGTVAEVYVAEGDSVSAGTALFKVSNEALDKALTDAEAQLASANEAASRANTTVTQAYDDYNAAVAAYNAGTGDASIVSAYETAVRTAEAARDEANAAVTNATRARDDANAALGKCTSTSPISGVVVSITRADASGGTRSTNESSISVQIADMSQMKVVVQVNEMDISTVTVGQQASATFTAVPDLELAATVESIANAATGDSSGSSGGVVTFGVTLVLPNPDPQLKPGMTASVSITTQDVPDALVIPLAAVSVDPNDPALGTVSRVVDDATYETETIQVTLGARDATRVVVDSGLEEDDVILLLSDGGAMDDASMAIA